MSDTTEYSIKNLLEAGAHFGHQAIHWNPKMSRYVFMKRKGIHIIDLQKTVLYLEKACNQLKNITAQGGKILFVGTKKQIKEIVKLKVSETEQYYMTQRWIGGLLTNYQVVSKSIERLREFTAILDDPEKQRDFTKNQLGKMRKERNKLYELYCGVADMNKLPEVVFIIDVFYEKNAALEAKGLGIPVFSIVDTNGDPDNVDVIIPGNDDAIRSVGLFLDYVIEAVKEGAEIYKRKREEEDLFAEQIKKEELLLEENQTDPKETQGDESAEKTEEIKSKPFMKSDVNNSKKPEEKKETVAVKPTESTESKTAEVKSEPQGESKKEKELNKAEGEETTVSAKDVKELRDLTDVSMMECKKALVKAQGNKEEAIKILKERGMAVAAKRADKEANEGVVFVKAEGSKAWMVNVCCETDFVAKSEHFNGLVTAIEESFVKQGPSYFEGEEFKSLIAETTSRTGEKLEVNDICYSKTSGKFFSYLHSNHKVGVILALESDSPEPLNTPEVEELGKDLCLQVAAMNPVAVSMDKVSPQEIEEQKQVFLKQMEDDNKPAEIKEKMLAGKIKKHFSELCLLDMEFVKESGKSVGDLVAEVSKKAGGEIRIAEFKRNRIGS